MQQAFEDYKNTEDEWQKLKDSSIQLRSKLESVSGNGRKKEAQRNKLRIDLDNLRFLILDREEGIIRMEPRLLHHILSLVVVHEVIEETRRK
jgi:hypothetical protein